VTVKIRRHDFTTFTRQRRVTPATNDTQAVARVARELLTAWLGEHRGAKIRLLGVGVSQLTIAEQLDLFSAANPKGSSSKLDRTLDAIREKFGSQALTRAGNLEDKSSHD
jgi:DNA polymerase-4